MKRRDFISKSLQTGVAVGAGLTFLPLEKTFGNVFSNSQALCDLAVIMGGEPDAMFEKGIAEFGGMKNYVKAGQMVVVKPNMAFDRTPEMGANTNPILVGRIVKECFNAGAKEVFVFDNTLDNWQRAYATSGIEKAAKDAGATVITGNSQGNYKDVTIPRGKSLKAAKVHEKILECDVFINVPVLKHHGGAQMSLGMKNLMGIVWDRRYWHSNNLHQCVADMVTYRKPDLNIVDCYRVMKRNGPRGVSASDISLEKAQIISTDIVAADAAATMIFGVEPVSIGYIRIANDMGLGVMDVSKLNIKRIRV